MYTRCAGKMSRLCLWSVQLQRPDWQCPNLARPYGSTFSLAVDHCVTPEIVNHHHRATAGMMLAVRVAKSLGLTEREAARVSRMGGEVGGLCPMIALMILRESRER